MIFAFSVFYAAYQAAMENRGSPTVILAKTIKGYGLGESGEGRNVTHQQKKLNEEELRHFRSRFGIPVPDDQIQDAPFYRPDEDSEEIRYLKERRRALGGYLPALAGGDILHIDRRLLLLEGNIGQAVAVR